MSCAPTLLQNALSLGVFLSRNGEHLHVDAPKGTLTPALRARLAEVKSDLLALIDKAVGDEPFDVYDPNFVEIVLLWRNGVSKPKTVAIELPGTSR